MGKDDDDDVVGVDDRVGWEVEGFVDMKAVVG